MSKNRVENDYISHQQVTQLHVGKPISYSEEEVDVAKENYRAS